MRRLKGRACLGEFGATVELWDGSEVDVAVEYSYEPGVPGKTYGPPEDCYPPEAESAEILSVTFDLPPDSTVRVEDLASGEMARLEGLAAEHARDAMQARYESAMEDRADARREREWGGES